MNVAVVYVYPSVNLPTYFPLAQRFAQTYQQFPAQYEHTLYVVHNGGPHPAPYLHPFEKFHHGDLVRSNLAWDIGAFQHAAETVGCDLLVCLGAPVHFHRPGWLERMVDAVVHEGPGCYGCWGFLYPNPHLRTTAFWLPPELLNSYPYTVGNTRPSRYGFEHGPFSFTRHVQNLGFPTIMTTLTGNYPYPDWPDHVPGVNDSLLLDQHCHR
jgi:hypothetical protein